MAAHGRTGAIIDACLGVQRANLELRLDAFSVFNQPVFGNPASDISNLATVGRITSDTGNRTIQIGALCIFSLKNEPERWR
jgi:hypothetical protein